MRRVLTVILLLIIAVSGTAQSFREGDEAFRERMRGFLDRGNRYYYLSNRPGIMSMVDSIDFNLRARSESGMLNPVDSLEFTAYRCRLLADWHYENGNYDSRSYRQAEELFQQALAIFSSGPFEKNYELFKRPVLYRELAQLYYKLARYQEALDYTCKAEEAYEGAWLNNYFYDYSPDWDQWQAIRMQKAMCLARVGCFEDAGNLADSVSVSVSGKDAETRYSVIRMHGKILLLKGSETSRKEAAPLYREYLAWRKADALKTMSGMTPAERQDYWMQTRPFVADACLLEDEDPALLYDVALFSKNLLLQMNLMSDDNATEAYLDHSWTDIRKALPQKAAAVEFVVYDGKMAALVVKKGSVPIWVKMPSQHEILDYEINGRPLRSRLSSTAGGIKNPVYVDDGLRELIWNADLIKALDGCSSIYFSPDGYLHQIAIEYMLPETLRDADCYRLTSTRQLLTRRAVSLRSALIIGGVDFNAELADDNATDNDAMAYSYMHARRLRLGYLKDSLDEANAIAAARGNTADLLYTGAAAAEQVFRSSAGNFSMLCISTHGYFQASETPLGSDIKPCMSDDALSESALFLSGANHSICSESFDPSTPDGILSAAEISGMDLSKIDIAVISACQTGLGYVTSEGVYGIQRGFKNAGAGCLIVSLWNVSDKATSMLMTHFQENLSNGMSVHAAFDKARHALSGKMETRKRRFNAAALSSSVYVDETDYSEPRYSNAFIIIDAIQ